MLEAGLLLELISVGISCSPEDSSVRTSRDTRSAWWVLDEVHASAVLSPLVSPTRNSSLLSPKDRLLVLSAVLRAPFQTDLSQKPSGIDQLVRDIPPLHSIPSYMSVMKSQLRHDQKMVIYSQFVRLGHPVPSDHSHSPSLSSRHKPNLSITVAPVHRGVLGQAVNEYEEPRSSSPAPHFMRAFSPRVSNPDVPSSAATRNSYRSQFLSVNTPTRPLSQIGSPSLSPLPLLSSGALFLYGDPEPPSTVLEYYPETPRSVLL